MVVRFQLSEIVSSFVREFLIIFLTLVRILVLPVTLTLLIPIYIWRRVVGWLGSVFRPDLVKMVVTRSSIMAVDDWMNRPRCNLVVTVGFEGELDMEQFLAEIDQKVLSKKDAEGKDLHPELKQYYEEWLGYIFWKVEENFHIKNHIDFYDQGSNPITTEDLSRIEGVMTYKPFPPNRSPWEVLYIRHFQPDNDANPAAKKSAVIFRLHHGIADGYSLLNLLLKDVCQLHEHQYALPNYPKRTILQEVSEQLKFAIKSQYEGSRQRIEGNDKNQWRVPKHKMSPNWFHMRSRSLPLSMLKEIKDGFGVSFTGMLVGGISGGIRQYFLKKGQPVPNSIHCVAPFPVPGHTTKLRNFYSFAFLKFPVGIEEPKQRMAAIEKNLKALKRSTTPRLNFIQLPVIGGLCTGLIKSIAKNLLTTGLMSNFPGPFKQCTFMNLPVIELGFTGGLLRGNQGVGFAILSYLGNLNIRMIGCQSLFPEETDLKDLLQEIEKEFYRLRDAAQV